MKVSPFQSGELQWEGAASQFTLLSSSITGSELPLHPSCVGDGMQRGKGKSYLTGTTMTFSTLWLPEMLKADSLSRNVFVGSLHNPIGNDDVH